MNSLRWMAARWPMRGVKSFVGFKLFLLLGIFFCLTAIAVITSDAHTSALGNVTSTDDSIDLGFALLWANNFWVIYLVVAPPLALIYLAPFYCDSWDAPEAPKSPCSRYVIAPAINTWTHLRVLSYDAEEKDYIPEDLVISENDYVWTLYFLAVNLYGIALCFIFAVHPAVPAVSIVLLVSYLALDLGPQIYSSSRSSESKEVLTQELPKA